VAWGPWGGGEGRRRWRGECVREGVEREVERNEKRKK